MLLLPLTAPLASLPDFAGHWEQACRARTIRCEDFTAEGAVTYTERFFADDACKRPTTISRSSGLITLPAPGQMDFKFERVTLEAASPEAVAWLNSVAFCGIRNWTGADPQEITGLKCDLAGNGRPVTEPRAGEMRYGIYRLEINTLALGQLTLDHMGLTPDTRPTSFDPLPYLRR